MNEQLEKWLNGNPVHDREADQCCPDFSCCSGNGMAPKEQRERFVKAIKENDERTRMEMLGMFLGAAFSGSYVAGLNTEGQNEN